MNKIINIILSGLLWRKYKFLIVSLILLIIFIFVVGQLHGDYLRYNQLQEGSSYVGISFAVKWLAWISSIIGVYTLNRYYYKNKKKVHPKSNSALTKILQWREKAKVDKVSQASTDFAQPDDVVETGEDPFARIRTKEKLRSYTDVMIDNKPQK